MFIVLDSSLVKYAVDVAPTMTERGLDFGTFVDISIATPVIVETNLALPEDWIGCKYLWQNDAFALNPEWVEF